MSFLKKLLNPATVKTVSVEIVRPCRVKLPSGAIVDADTGDRYDLTEKDAAELVHNNAAERLGVDEARQTKLANLNSLLPEPGEARPAPAEFEGLPEFFCQWWNLNEKGLILIHRHAEITERLIAEAKRFCNTANIDSINRGITSGIDRDRVIAAVGHALQIGNIPQDHIDKLTYLRDAEARAEQAVNDWRAANVGELTRLRIACSDFTQDQHGELCRNIRELHQLGFDLFATRIAALGLGEVKAKELFRGSADAVKFASIERPCLQDLRLAYADEGESPKLYIDVAVGNMVSLITGWQATGEQVATLTKQAKAELSKARKVTQLAAA